MGTNLREIVILSEAKDLQFAEDEVPKGGARFRLAVGACPSSVIVMNCHPEEGLSPTKDLRSDGSDKNADILPTSANRRSFTSLRMTIHMRSALRHD